MLKVVRLRTVGWAVIVVVGGILVALPFRKPPSILVPLQPGEEELPRQADPITLQVASRPIALPISEAGQERPIPLSTQISPADLVDSKVNTSNLGIAGSERLQAVKTLPPIPTSSQASSTLTPPTIPAAAIEHPTSTRDLASAKPRLHRIVDGDTLPRIAKRYLGDANRWPEIYQNNRDALADPDLLPVGVEIEILMGINPMKPATTAESIVPLSNVENKLSSPPTTQLVPVPIETFRSR